MESLYFTTKERNAGAHIHDSAYLGSEILIGVYSNKTGKQLNLYRLPVELKDQVSNIKSYSALVAFAKANYTTDIVVSTKQLDKQLAPCPVPAPAPAKSAAKGQGILFVEVDTIGRGKSAEIIQVSVVDTSNNLVFFSNIKPTKLQNAVPSGYPSFSDVWKSFSDAIGRADIAFYNADHSKRMILQSLAKAFDTPIPDNFRDLFPYNSIVCIGERYKEFNNNRLGYFRNYGLQHINSACGQCGLSWRDLSNRSSGNARKSSMLYNYLNHKELAV